MTTSNVHIDAPIAHCSAKLLELLRTHAYRKGTFTLASGRQSDFYIDCRNVVLSAQGHVLVGKCIEHIVRTDFPQAIAIGGMCIGANPLASATACISQLLTPAAPLHAFYVRKQAKGHGTQQYVEGLGNLPQASTSPAVVMVEDVITTGASTIEAIERARDAGLRPIGVIALVDRNEGGKARLTEHSPVKSLFSRTDFV